MTPRRIKELAQAFPQAWANQGKLTDQDCADVARILTILAIAIERKPFSALVPLLSDDPPKGE